MTEDSWTDSLDASEFYTTNTFYYNGTNNENFAIRALQIGTNTGLTYYTSVNLVETYTIVAAYNSSQDVNNEISFSIIQKYDSIISIYDALDVDDSGDFLVFMGLDSSSSPVIYYLNVTASTYLSYTDGDRAWEEYTWSIGKFYDDLYRFKDVIL